MSSDEPRVSHARFGSRWAQDVVEIAEGVDLLIADLVRNDLSPVCRPGTVSVDALCAPEEHPGLAHLVTTVSGELRPGVR